MLTNPWPVYGKGLSSFPCSTNTSVRTMMFRGERNVDAPDPALLALTDKRIVVLDHKEIIRRK